MKLLLTLLSMATLAAAGTITAKDYKDATCTKADKECGVDDADKVDGDCPEGKETEKQTKSMTFTADTCMKFADDPDGFMGAAAGAPAASWKIVCSGGKGVVKLFTDGACATAIATSAAGSNIDTALTAAFSSKMPAGVTLDFKWGVNVLDDGFAATPQCMTVATFAADKAAMVAGGFSNADADTYAAVYNDPATVVTSKTTMCGACGAPACPAPPPAASNAAHAAPLLVLLVGYFA